MDPFTEHGEAFLTFGRGIRDGSRRRLRSVHRLQTTINGHRRKVFRGICRAGISRPVGHLALLRLCLSSVIRDTTAPRFLPLSDKGRECPDRSFEIADTGPGARVWSWD